MCIVPYLGAPILPGEGIKYPGNIRIGKYPLIPYISEGIGYMTYYLLKPAAFLDTVSYALTLPSHPSQPFNSVSLMAYSRRRPPPPLPSCDSLCPAPAAADLSIFPRYYSTCNLPLFFRVSLRVSGRNYRGRAPVAPGRGPGSPGAGPSRAPNLLRPRGMPRGRSKLEVGNVSF